MHICERTYAYIHVYIHIGKTHIDFVICICVCTCIRFCSSYCIMAGWGAKDSGLCERQEPANRDYKSFLKICHSWWKSICSTQVQLQICFRWHDDPPKARACARMRARVGVLGHMWQGLHCNVSRGELQTVFFVTYTESLWKWMFMFIGGLGISWRVLLCARIVWGT